MSAKDAKIVKREPLESKDAKWTKLVLTTYTSPDGRSRLWEHAERPTRPRDSAADGVGVVAILQKETGPELLLQKQFRPPIGMVSIEVPAGLIDAGESIERCAERELKEETGYVGKATVVSPVMFNDPGFCNTNVHMVQVDVDMALPENRDPRPELEENEFIETFSVPLRELYEWYVRLDKEGFAIDARVGTLVEGVEMARRWGL